MHDPDQDGWICTSRWIYVQNGYIVNPYSGHTEKIENSHFGGYYTKFIFRLIPGSTISQDCQSTDDESNN